MVQKNAAVSHRNQIQTLTSDGGNCIPPHFLKSVLPRVVLPLLQLL